MTVIKRLATTLFSRIDHVVGEIENHDAVIRATLTDMSKRFAEAKVQLHHLQRERTRLEEECHQQTEKAKLWKARAVNCAHRDEIKAIDCLRRRRQCEHRITRLGEAIKRYQEAESTLVRDIDASEQQLQELKQKQTVFRARESSAAVLNAGKNQSETFDLVEKSFDRWETNLFQAELSKEAPMESDDLESGFLSEEEERDLRDELASIKTEEQRP